MSCGCRGRPSPRFNWPSPRSAASSARSPEMSPDHGPITVVLATDSFLIGEGLAALLADNDDVKVIGRARHHSELPQLVDELNPEAVIISIRTPVITTMATIEVARRLRVDHPAMGMV